MTVAERLGWTTDDLRFRRTMVQMSQDTRRFEEMRRVAAARRTQRAKIVWCAACIVKDLS